MLMYWLLFIITSGMALSFSRKQQYQIMPLLLLGAFFILIIGFRDRVGGDWYNYIGHYEDMSYLTLSDALLKGDPAHQFLNYLSNRWDLGVYGTNVVYGVIFMIGLIKFSRLQLYPWIAIAVAVPYLIIVVVMGYSRQGVAIGLFLWGISYLNRGNFKMYIVFILLAALFHKTALLLLPLGIFLYGKGMTLRILMIVPVAFGAWDLLLAKEQDDLWKNYVEVQMMSDGAKIRVAMNFLPALLLFKYKNEWKKSFNDYSFWFWIAIGSLLSVGLVNFASTAVDRVALYFIPIQLAVFARLPYLARHQIASSTTKLLIVAYYGLVLFVWLIFATHSQYWIPYHNILL